MCWRIIWMLYWHLAESPFSFPFFLDHIQFRSFDWKGLLLGFSIPFHGLVLAGSSAE